LKYFALAKQIEINNIKSRDLEKRNHLKKKQDNCKVAREMDNYNTRFGIQEEYNRRNP